VPPQKREVYYFDKNITKGLSWYSRFFPTKGEGYSAVGEVTPKYLYCQKKKIEYIKNNFDKLDRFIVLLRDPVERLHSHYLFRKRQKGVEQSFERFVEDNEEVKDMGLYYRNLSKWVDVFGRNRFLILLTKRDLPRYKKARTNIANFLDIRKGLFPENAGKKKKNESFMPVLSGTYKTLIKVRNYLHNNEIYWPSRIARSAKVKYWLGYSTVEEGINNNQKRKIYQYYKKDIEKLEQIGDISLSNWKYTDV